jgi:hypothetical protein
MSAYVARINPISFYAMVVRVDNDGEEQVDCCFRPRHFTSLKAAQKATGRYINSIS